MILRTIKKIQLAIKILQKQKRMMAHSIREQILQEYVQKENNVCVDPNFRVGSNEVIISLTSFGSRIYDVHLAIESIFQNTIKPTKVILNLSEDEFSPNNLPKTLESQLKRGLEIHFCEDLKSYKKLIPTLVRYPSSIIITIDDDVIYPYNFIELLLNEYTRKNNSIYFYRGYEIKRNKKNNLSPYKTWKSCDKYDSSLLYLPTGVGGVLYPPGCFHKDVTNVNLFQKYAPTGDDIWFKAMTLLKGYTCKQVFDYDNFYNRFHILERTQVSSLVSGNMHENRNDTMLKAVFGYYDLWDKVDD